MSVKGKQTPGHCWRREETSYKWHPSLLLASTSSCLPLPSTLDLPSSLVERPHCSPLFAFWLLSSACFQTQPSCKPSVKGPVLPPFWGRKGPVTHSSCLLIRNYSAKPKLLSFPKAALRPPLQRACATPSCTLCFLPPPGPGAPQREHIFMSPQPLAQL